MENNQVQIDIKFVYEVAMEELIQKEREIIGLKALCNQLTSQLHDAMHKIEDIKKGE